MPVDNPHNGIIPRSYQYGNQSLLQKSPTFLPGIRDFLTNTDRQIPA
jgi:hypothetical protein